MNRIPAPAPGVYGGVPAAEYHAWEAASSSLLSVMHDRSPAHLRAELENPRDRTPALILGDAIHLAVLQPELWPGPYAVAGQCNATLKTAGTRCRNAGVVLRGGDWYCGVKGHDPSPGAPGDVVGAVLSTDDWNCCIRLRSAVERHPAASGALSYATDREVSIVWDDPETGIRCKARLDAPAWELGVVGDLKSTEDASPRAFRSSIWNYGYHRQAAHYLGGCSVLAAAGLMENPPPDLWTFIAVEKREPFAVAVYELDAPALDAGRRQLRPLLRVYAECLESDRWPAYSEDAQPISLPEWAFKQLD